MPNFDQLANWPAGLLDELGRLPEYLGQLGTIASFFGDVGRTIGGYVVATNDGIRSILQQFTAGG